VRFIAVRVFLSDGSSKTLQKCFTRKNRVESFLQKIRPEIQNQNFLGFLLSRFWAFFLVRGVQKHHFKTNSKKTDPGLFLASDPHPPTAGVADIFVFSGPLSLVTYLAVGRPVFVL
jgi:hypothetical protein